MTDATTATLKSAHAAAAGPLRVMALGLLLGAVLLGAWQACAGTHARRRSHRSAAAPEPVQHWENEGGTPGPRPD